MNTDEEGENEVREKRRLGLGEITDSSSELE